jgi:signal transduction histidine kinase
LKWCGIISWSSCGVKAVYGQQETTTFETSPDRLFIQGIASPLKDALPGMTLLLFQDLTRVRKLETVRRDFVSNVSHELRTPLASLKAVAETLQEGAGRPARCPAFLAAHGHRNR